MLDFTTANIINEVLLLSLKLYMYILLFTELLLNLTMKVPLLYEYYWTHTTYKVSPSLNTNL